MSEVATETPTLRLRRMDAAALEVAEILRTGAIRVLLQPIVSTAARTVMGLKALVRGPSNSWLHLPLNRFAAGSLVVRASIYVAAIFSVYLFTLYPGAEDSVVTKLAGAGMI